MIPTAAITAWRQRAPWALAEQVEQDLVLSRALIELYGNPLLASELAFRGGTALHKLYLTPAGRYSEDIDLVQVRASAIGPVLSAIRETLGPWLGEAKYKAGEGRATLSFRFTSEGALAVPMRVKIEINTREHGSILPLVRVPHRVESVWFQGGAELLTYVPEELLGTKLRALYQRRKGRDLYDLSTALKRLERLDRAAAVSCFLACMEQGGTPVSRAEFERNLSIKRSDPAFLGDVAPLLSLGAGRWDANQALDQVQDHLIALLPGAPWAGLATSPDTPSSHY